MPDFLAKIREESIATLTPTERDSLADEILEKSSDPIAELAPREFVRQWKVDDLLDSFDANRQPDLVRGKKLFVAASCSRCHRINGDGMLIGPDLTAASGRYRRRDLLTAIIEPSQVIAENYRSVQVVTVDGETYAGQVAAGGDYRSPMLRLATDATKPFEITEIEKNRIETQKFSSVSWMPAELLNTLSADEVHDLVAYIESGGR
jgi:putative heme-binding domain-containing protein